MKDWRDKIKERDGYKCVISGREDNLVIHHIKTFGSGGDDSYCNMVTLNAFVHTGKVHGQVGRKYRKILEDYTSQFIEPEGRHIYKTMAEKARAYKNSCDRHVDKIKRVYKKKTNTPYVDDQKKMQNACNRKKSKEITENNQKLFEAKYGMTPSQYKYRKQKEYLESKKQK